MPSDSIAGFLDHAQAVRVLFPEQIEQLIRQPDIPQSDLSQLCEYLLSRGVLTRFQANAVRESRGQELNFAGYPILDEIGPCPGGTAYKALHPSLRTPVVLRRIRADWLAPADNGANYVNRARAFGMIAHPNVLPLLDAGFYCDELFVVTEQPAGADLDALEREVGGAMPGFLAAEYARAVASVLRAVHERGGFHGDVRPANIFVSPLSTKITPDGVERRRPAPDAVVRVTELGLVPVRPPAAQLLPGNDVIAFLPPERVGASSYDPRGDIYGLGATLHFLLSGRPPFAAGEPAELLEQVRSEEPVSLAELRPDLSPELIELVSRMMEKHPDRRPATAFDVEAALVPFCRPGTLPPTAIPVAAPASGVDLSEPIPVLTPVSDSDVWGVDPGRLVTVHPAGDTDRRVRETSAADRARTRLLLVLGGLLHLTAVGLVVAWALGAFSSTPEADAPSKKSEPTKKSTSRRAQPN